MFRQVPLSAGDAVSLEMGAGFVEDLVGQPMQQTKDLTRPGVRTYTYSFTTATADYRHLVPTAALKTVYPQKSIVCDDFSCSPSKKMVFI